MALRWADLLVAARRPEAVVEHMRSLSDGELAELRPLLASLQVAAGAEWTRRERARLAPAVSPKPTPTQEVKR